MSLADAMTIEVRAFSRLHFGLLEICPGQPHCYGGVGIMIDVPVSSIRGQIDSEPVGERIEIIADTYWLPRIEGVIKHWCCNHGSNDLPLQTIEVIEPPHAHVGLGSGTQFACSVAALLTAAASRVPTSQVATRKNESKGRFRSIRHLYQSTDALAAESGRGKRSFIGLEGFRSGGLIVDLGHNADCTIHAQATPKLRTAAYKFPSAWRIVTACDRSYIGDFGAAESAIFERCASRPNPHRDAMLKAIENDLLPALDALDWMSASQAIGRYGVMAGEIFRPLQGGIYRSPSIASAVSHLQAAGVAGVGQSSWGPTLFAIARDEEHAEWIAHQLRSRMAVGTTVEIAGPAGEATYELGSSC